LESARGDLRKSSDLSIENAKDAADNAIKAIDNNLEELNRKTQESIVNVLGGFKSVFENLKNLAEEGFDFNSLNTFGKKVTFIKNAIAPLIVSLKEAGPDGAVTGNLIQSAFEIGEAWTYVDNIFRESGTGIKETLTNLAGAFNAVGSVVSQIGALQASASQASIQGIESEIDAEKKRDGKSRESLARLASLEAKSEKLKRKAFEEDKKAKIAQTAMATAAGVMQAFAQGGILGFVLGGVIAAIGASQIAAISSTSYSGGSAAASTGAGISASIGERSSTVDVAKPSNQSGELGFLRGDDGVGGIQNFKPAFTGTRNRQTGGSTGFIVGEQGPELFIPDRPGMIRSADDTENLSGGLGNVNFTIQAVDAAGVEDLLSNQRGNIISMLRQAANQHGELFLESVDTNSLT
jgi:hypothetical protein